MGPGEAADLRRAVDYGWFNLYPQQKGPHSQSCAEQGRLPWSAAVAGRETRHLTRHARSARLARRWAKLVAAPRPRILEG